MTAKREQCQDCSVRLRAISEGNEPARRFYSRTITDGVGNLRGVNSLRHGFFFTEAGAPTPGPGELDPSCFIRSSTTSSKRCPKPCETSCSHMQSCWSCSGHVGQASSRHADLRLTAARTGGVRRRSVAPERIATMNTATKNTATKNTGTFWRRCTSRLSEPARTVRSRVSILISTRL